MFILIIDYLESEFLEEVVASGGLLLACDSLLVQIPILENLLQTLFNIHLPVSIGKFGLIDNFLQIHINNITCGEDVTDVDVLDKWLHHLGSLFDLFLRHRSGDLARSTLNPSDEAVGETAVSTSIFNVFDNHGLLSGMASSKDNYYLSTFCEGLRGQQIQVSE